MVEPSARFEEIKIPLHESVRGVTEVSAVLGVPQWWPTGQRVGVVFAHGLGRDMSDPVLEFLQNALTERRCLTLRFNFPFGETGKKRPDPPEVLQRTFRAAIATMSQDPNAAPTQDPTAKISFDAAPGFDATVDCFVLYDLEGDAVAAMPSGPFLYERMRGGGTVKLVPFVPPEEEEDDPEAEPIVPLDTVLFRPAVAGKQKTKGFKFDLGFKVKPGTVDRSWK